MVINFEMYSVTQLNPNHYFYSNDDETGSMEYKGPEAFFFLFPISARYLLDDGSCVFMCLSTKQPQI